MWFFKVLLCVPGAVFHVSLHPFDLTLQFKIVQVVIQKYNIYLNCVNYHTSVLPRQTTQALNKCLETYLCKNYYFIDF